MLHVVGLNQKAANGLERNRAQSEEQLPLGRRRSDENWGVKKGFDFNDKII